MIPMATDRRGQRPPPSALQRCAPRVCGCRTAEVVGDRATPGQDTGLKAMPGHDTGLDAVLGDPDPPAFIPCHGPV